MTTKKTKSNWTHNQLIKEIKKLIRIGNNVDMIIHIMHDQVPIEIMDRTSLSDLCEKVVMDYPSYDLIQKIVRSKLVINVDEKPDKFYIVDPESDVVGTINSLNAKSLFLKPDFSDRTYLAEFTYSPYVLKKLYKDKGFWKFNTYNAPFWLIDHFYYGKVVGTSEMPGVYKKFLLHLTDEDSDSYEYILDWMSTMLTSRNYCILSTIGSQGIGKGVLGTIMEKLIGIENYSLTDNRLITKEFNAQILNKRLVYIDELKVTNAKEENRLKLLINDTVEVEAKGIDSVNVTNYASIYVSSNDLDAVRLRGDDRRFSIVSLTDKKLIEHMNQGEIEELLADESISKMARYLWHRKVERRMNQVFVSARTAEVRESALKNWEEWFVEDFLVKNKGKAVPIVEVSDAVENIFGSRTRPSRKALNKLRELYPSLFSIVRKQVGTGEGKSRIWHVKVAEEIGEA